MTKEKITEAQLAASVVRFFEDQHWEVFPEVQCYQGSNRADLVVRQGKILGVIECKLALGLPVLEQAFGWRGHSNFVWVATVHRNAGEGRLVHTILKDYGIGWLALYGDSDDLRERTKPAFMRRPPLRELLEKQLVPERKLVGEGVAGGNRGGFFTPFKRTCWELERIVKEQPGITLKEALGQFKHHYSNTRSAMCNLPEWIDKGKVEGVRIDRSDGKLRLVLVTPGPVENATG